MTFHFDHCGHHSLPDGSVIRLDMNRGMYMGSYFQRHCEVWAEPELRLIHQFWGSLQACQQEIANWLGEVA